MNKHHIHIDRVTKSFAQFTLAIDLRISEGEIVSLLGPSGCGKSTTLSLINGILHPDGGRIMIDDLDITEEPIWQREIGYVFQDYALFPHMNVAENIGYSLKIAKEPARLIRKRVDELLELMHLEGYGERKVQNLSGGEKQRIALARAVASRPRLLLLDEPLSALDAKLRVNMRKEIQRIHRDLGLTTLYVTHDQEEALAISDRIAVMNRGSIEQIGTPEEIYYRPASLFAADFIGTSNMLPASDSSYVVFRPEHVSIQQNNQDTDGMLVFSGAQLQFEEFAGRHYLCTFIYNEESVTAYSSEKLPIGESFELVVDKKNTQILSK